MSTWLIADTLSCVPQWFASHLDSWTHYISEFGHQADSVCLNLVGVGPWSIREGDYIGGRDFLLALDQYERCAGWPFAAKKIAMVASVHPVMPWDVRDAQARPAYSGVVSSIPWMVEAAKAAGLPALFLPLAFDLRARACMMGVKREKKCIFIGTVGPNHQRRAKLLEELRDVVEVRPPVFGRAMFRELASASVVFNVHAEWSRGVANNMRLFEAGGMGCDVVSDGVWPVKDDGGSWWWSYSNATEARCAVESALDCPDPETDTIVYQSYESRIPTLIEWARSL